MVVCKFCIKNNANYVITNTIMLKVIQNSTKPFHTIGDFCLIIVAYNLLNSSLHWNIGLIFTPLQLKNQIRNQISFLHDFTLVVI